VLGEVTKKARTAGHITGNLARQTPGIVSRGLQAKTKDPTEDFTVASLEPWRQKVQDHMAQAGKDADQVGGILREFFKGDDMMFHEKIFESLAAGSDEVVHGIEWPLETLRGIQTQGLHVLWFSLLKERNRLFTIRHEFVRNNGRMPSPHRLNIIACSMDHLRTVLEEREKAKNFLKKGSIHGQPGQMTVDFRGNPKWTRYREYPIEKEDQPEHLQEHAFSYNHPDQDLQAPEIREWQLRRDEFKHAETVTFYEMLGKRWQSYRLAYPDDNLPERPPKWWMELDNNQPKYQDSMWITNLPVAYKSEKKRITQNAPNDPNP